MPSCSTPARSVQRWPARGCCSSPTRVPDQKLQKLGTRQQNPLASCATSSFGIPVCGRERVARIGITISAPQEGVGGDALYAVAVEFRLRHRILVSCHAHRLSLEGSMRRASSSNCSATFLSADEPPVVRARRASLRHDAACSRSSSAASERVVGCITAAACGTAALRQCARRTPQQICHESGARGRKTRARP